MTARLGTAIESLLQIRGIVAAVFVDSAGHAIEGASCADDDLAAAARSAREILQRWAAVGMELGIGGVRSVLIEQTGGPVTIAAGARGAALVVVGDRSCRPGRVRREAGRARAAAMSAWAEDTPAAIDPVEERTGAAAATASGGRLTAGEIVLVGAHPFRLVTRLVARLLQAKGVRSSRLRAYSPDSTVIDVELEEGGTLDAIAGDGFGDLPVEPAAESGTRLVLKPARRSLGMPSPIGSAG